MAPVDGLGPLAEHHDDRRVQARKVEKGNGDQTARGERGFCGFAGGLVPRGEHETLESVEGLGPGEPHQGAMTDHGALGAAGGPAGVEDQARVVFGNRLIGQCRVR